MPILKLILFQAHLNNLYYYCINILQFGVGTDQNVNFEEKCFQLIFDSSANNTPLKLHTVMDRLIGYI